MKHRSRQRPYLLDHGTNALRRQIPLILVAVALIFGTYNAAAETAAWEYKVVVLQGVTAGGTIERDANGVFVDVKRTRELNTLAADGWEVVTVTGAVATDHTVYLRRRTAR